MTRNAEIIENLTVSAPGRICLAGEHQDYLNLPVIPAAIDLRIRITGRIIDDRVFNILMPDINAHDDIRFDDDIPYLLERDYLRSGVNVIKREGIKFNHGYDIEIHGDIPINSGTSSSSALCVAWIKFLLTIANHEYRNNHHQIAYLAYLAEVEEFGEPGGMMDQSASAYGNVIWVDFTPQFKVVKLPKIDGTFVLGDSHQEKDTKRTLARIKSGTLQAAEKIRAQNPNFTLQESEISDIQPLLNVLPDDQRLYLEGALRTRDLTKQARQMFESGDYTYHDLGSLLDSEHDVLRDYLKIATDKIDRMLHAAKHAGAYGGKINGSGEGGCMFVYAPDYPEKVADAIEQAGGTAYIIKISDGASVEY